MKIAVVALAVLSGACTSVVEQQKPRFVTASGDPCPALERKGPTKCLTPAEWRADRIGRQMAKDASDRYHQNIRSAQGEYARNAPAVVQQ